MWKVLSLTTQRKKLCIKSAFIKPAACYLSYLKSLSEQSTDSESKDEKLPPSFELLYNFRCNGYMLFYFVLKDLEQLLFNKAHFLQAVVGVLE